MTGGAQHVPLHPQTSSTVHTARLRNLNKRVKLHSKRLRHVWPHIAVFLAPVDVVVVSSACRHLYRLLDTDRVWCDVMHLFPPCAQQTVHHWRWLHPLTSTTVWRVVCRQTQYDRVVRQQVTRLLVPRLETRLDATLPVKEKLRRVVSALPLSRRCLFVYSFAVSAALGVMAQLQWVAELLTMGADSCSTCP